jgi:FkbH-like protein
MNLALSESLTYPFNAEQILAKRKRLRRELLACDFTWIDKRIAILGGSTTNDIREILELFLLSHGIRCECYESEYAQYWQDAVFPNPELDKFKPDLIFVHTSNRNIMHYPKIGDNETDINLLLETEINRFTQMWESLASKYARPIIQNNFEYPFYRLLGNKDATDIHGKVNFITKLNLKFADYAQSHPNFYINDINWLSADFGLSQWSDPLYWHMYKYALALPAIPYLCHNVSNIIKSLFGKNKKAFAIDLDNTLWGGIVGDDGAENLVVGQETSMGQVYSEFQSYLKDQKQLGVILNVVSKNEETNAIAGLNRPDNTLKPDDFIVIKANWEPKPQNIQAMANELTLLPESFVFVDDNPAEREIVRQQIQGIAVPELVKPEQYIFAIDRAGYFEVTNLSDDDLRRNEMYHENLKRSNLQLTFSDYKEYLISLEMTADILPFESMYMSRIAQLTNKSNQFNLTTRRYTQEEIETISVDQNRITLFGKLVDKFGDNGVVTVIIGLVEGELLHIELWLMSCRVLKREMEDAMLDELVRIANERGIKKIHGYYYPTSKNGMVRDFYDVMGFKKVAEDADGNIEWVLETSDYSRRCKTINVNGGGI